MLLLKYEEQLSVATAGGPATPPVLVLLVQETSTIPVAAAEAAAARHLCHLHQRSVFAAILAHSAGVEDCKGLGM